MPYDYQTFSPSIAYNPLEEFEREDSPRRDEPLDSGDIDFVSNFFTEVEFRRNIFEYMNREAKIAGYISIGDAISLKNSSLTGARAEADKWIQFLDDSLNYYDEKVKDTTFKDLNRETLITDLKNVSISPEEPGLTYI